MNNQFLMDFFQRREIAAKKPAEPNPTKKHKGTPKPASLGGGGTISLAHILEKKPPAKVVLEYIREKINKEVEQQVY